MSANRYLACTRSVKLSAYVLPDGRFPYSSRAYHCLVGSWRRAVLPTGFLCLTRGLEVVGARSTHPLCGEFRGRYDRFFVVLFRCFLRKFCVLFVPSSTGTQPEDEGGVARERYETGGVVRANRQVAGKRNVPHVSVVSKLGDCGVVFLFLPLHVPVLRNRFRYRFCHGQAKVDVGCFLRAKEGGLRRRPTWFSNQVIYRSTRRSVTRAICLFLRHLIRCQVVMSVCRTPPQERPFCRASSILRFCVCSVHPSCLVDKRQVDDQYVEVPWVLPIGVFRVLFPCYCGGFVVCRDRCPTSSVGVLSSSALRPGMIDGSPAVTRLVPVCGTFFATSALVYRHPPTGQEGTIKLVGQGGTVIIEVSTSTEQSVFSGKIPNVNYGEFVKVSYASGSLDMGTGSVHYSVISPVPVVPPLRASVPALHTTYGISVFYSYM